MAFATSGAAQIYYEVYGTGPALVFAHGRGGNAASWWQQVPVFARDYKVIVFDHRCFGRSQCAVEDFDRAHFDADLIAVLDAAEVETAAVVCQSMGGWTGLRAALHYPERIRCLVLSNTPAGVDLPVVHEALSKAREAFASEGVGSAAVARDFPERRPEAAYLYQQISDLNLQIPEALSYGTEGSIDPAELADFAIPTLFVTSEYDAMLPPDVIREVANLIPEAEYVVLPSAGHSTYFETPEQYNASIAPFLARHTG
jgi:3-oxoadipate enol-lactonase